MLNIPSADHIVVDMLFEALEALTRGETALWTEMFVQDGVMEFPFAPPGYPPRLEGKPAIKTFIDNYPAHIQLHRVRREAVYQSGSSLIVEMNADGTALATGKPFLMHYIAVLELEGDRIRRYRDYFNPLVAITAMGGIEALNDLGKAPHYGQ